jgi:2-methylaconitate cis-trans-isomerase PrpF
MPRLDFGLPITLIRGGTSRGLYVRAQDLPDGAARDHALLRAFGGESNLIADGVGGENPVLRRIAIVSPDDTSPERLRYEFAQVDEELTTLDRSTVCGNLAAGVPLFGALSDWVQPPAAGRCVEILLANSGQRMRAEWLDGDLTGGRLRMTFVDIVPKVLLPLGEARSLFRVAGRSISYSVVSGANTSLFVRASDAGVADPLAESATAPAVFDLLDAIARDALARLPRPMMLKICVVADEDGAGSRFRARTYYLAERRTHPSVAVSGAATLAIARCIEGTILHQPARDRILPITVKHPSGELQLKCERGSDGMPAEISLERSCRLIVRGLSY